METKTFIASDESKAKIEKIRIIAIISWIVVVGIEVGAFRVLIKATTINNWLIVIIVVDLIFVFLCSLLLKKSDRLDSESGKGLVIFFIHNQLGLIIDIIAYLPPVIMLIFTNKNLNGKQKNIVGSIAVITLLICCHSDNLQGQRLEEYTNQYRTENGSYAQNRHNHYLGKEFEIYQNIGNPDNPQLYAGDYQTVRFFSDGSFEFIINYCEYLVMVTGNWIGDENSITLTNQGKDYVSDRTQAILLKRLGNDRIRYMGISEGCGPHTNDVFEKIDHATRDEIYVTIKVNNGSKSLPGIKLYINDGNQCFQEFTDGYGEATAKVNFYQLRNLTIFATDPTGQYGTAAYRATPIEFNPHIYLPSAPTSSETASTIIDNIIEVISTAEDMQSLNELLQNDLSDGHSTGTGMLGIPGLFSISPIPRLFGNGKIGFSVSGVLFEPLYRFGKCSSSKYGCRYELGPM